MRVRAGIGSAWQERSVQVRQIGAGFSTAGGAWRGTERCGTARHGRSGVVGRVLAGLSMARQEWIGPAHPAGWGAAWYDRIGSVWMAWAAGEARLGREGMTWIGVAGKAPAVRLGGEGTAGSGRAGADWQGEAGQIVASGATLGSVVLGNARLGRLGSPGFVRHRPAVGVRHGPVISGLRRHGKAGAARLGKDRRGVSGQGRSGQGRIGPAGLVVIRHGRRSTAWHGRSGPDRHGRHG